MRLSNRALKLIIFLVGVPLYLLNCTDSTKINWYDSIIKQPVSAGKESLTDKFKTDIRQWNLIGPGDADQVTSLSILENGTIILGTGIGGLYHSFDQGESWQAMNNGIKNYDITTPVLQDSLNPEILYVGTRGGLYTSRDAGNSWHNKRNGLPEKERYKLSGSIGGITIDPFDNRILFLGLGYRPSSDGTRTVKKIKWSKYIFKSNDRGESWKKIIAFPDNTKVYQLIHSSTERDVLYAATSRGIYMGTNGGTLWRKIFNKGTLNILLFPDNDAKILAACGKDGVYITDNRGKTWEAKNTGLSFRRHPSGPDRYSALAIDPGNTSRLYALNSTWGLYGGLYVSEDQGNYWKRLTSSLPESWLKTSRRMNAVAISPNNPEIIFLGSSRYVYRSLDGGKSWEQLISKRIGKGWSHRGLNVFGHTRKVAVDPANPDIIYIGTVDHGIVKSEDGGKSWDKIGGDLKFGDNIWDIDICRADSKIVYIAASDFKGNYCMSVSRDRGVSWKSLCEKYNKRLKIYKALVNPDNCEEVFFTTDRGVMKSTNYGKTWFSSSKGLPDAPVYAITFYTGNPETIYAGSKKGLYKSHDSGLTWSGVKTDTGTIVRSVLVSRKDPRVIFIGVDRARKNQGGIFRSKNGGLTWVRVLEVNKLVSGLAQLPLDPNIIYASSNDLNYHDESQGSGVFRSADHGLTWESMNRGLPVLRAWNISTGESAPGRVFLSSNGSGAYVIEDPGIK